MLFKNLLWTIFLTSFLFCSRSVVVVVGEAGRRRGGETARVSSSPYGGTDRTSGDREGKFLSLFQVVSFPNDPCFVAGSKNGTCFTAAECSSRGGANAGSCAQGFGVCCTITINCGDMSSENCTYFDSNTVVAGACSATICPCGNDICQLRLDFETFVITGPSTDPAEVTKRVVNSGVVGPGGTVSVAAETQCLTDRFTVSSGSGVAPPVICGTNSGEHMYVDADDDCNTLNFQFGATAQGAAIPTRSFSIKVTQFNCGFPNLAPQGCTQYFFGANADNVMSFNYNGGAGLHLADQDQQICVRRERGNCRICFTPANPATDFALSGAVAGDSFNSGSLCCSFGVTTIIADTAIEGFDCVQIPGARSVTDGNPINSNICGNGGFKAGAADGTVCSVVSPFRLNFRSDAFDVTPEAGSAAANNLGFNLVYFMDSTNCIAGAPTIAS